MTIMMMIMMTIMMMIMMTIMMMIMMIAMIMIEQDIFPERTYLTNANVPYFVLSPHC